MGKMSNFLDVIWIIAIILVGIALAAAPIIWISRQILAPIDRAAKFRKAPVRFSIGDFLCLFLAIQIPLAAVHRTPARGPRVSSLPHLRWMRIGPEYATAGDCFT